jgi:NADH:ubiquinone reductase (H+-translocating)
MQQSSQQSQHVLILGGGYAGVMAAIRLAKKTRPAVAITLVNSTPSFYERVRNHQVAAGQPVGRHSLPALLHGTRIRFVQGFVADIDPSARRVMLRAGEGSPDSPMRYDYLVYALGSTSRTGVVAGAQEHAYTLDHPSVAVLSARMPDVARRGGRVLVIGGGPTGVELATELAEAYPDARISLVTRRDVLPRFSPNARAYVRRALAKLGVELVEQTAIIEVQPDAAVAADGRRFPVDASVLTGGFGVSDLARRAGFRVNSRGQILTDRTLRSLSHPDVYAVGDAAMPAEEPGAPVRMSVLTALEMGAHGADALAARLNGRQPTAFGLSYGAAGISLGRRNGVVQFLDGSRDTPRNTILTGRFAVSVREFFVRVALGVIKAQRVAPWVFEWPGRRKMRHVALPPAESFSRQGADAAVAAAAGSVTAVSVER